MTSPTPTTTASVYTEQHRNTTTENKSLNTNWHLREDSVVSHARTSRGPEQPQNGRPAKPRPLGSRDGAQRGATPTTDVCLQTRGLRVMNSKF